MKEQGSKISVVIPVYRSEHTLDELTSRLFSTLSELGRPFELILIDDQSPDQSWRTLQSLKHGSPQGAHMRIARLSRNSGQHNAILCGFTLVEGDIVVTMDDDLQNPPEEVPKLIEAIDQGYDLAIGSYDSKQHSNARNASGDVIDRIQRKIFGLPSDFKLTSFRAVRRKVVDDACQMGSSYPYITAMLLSHTAHYTNVPVHHAPRLVGESNYTLNKSLHLAVNLVLNYSSYPVTVMAIACFVALLFTMIYSGVVLFQALVMGTGVPGWASTILIISFFNSVLLVCMLILGVYVSRLSRQISRTRPSFTVDELDG